MSERVTDFLIMLSKDPVKLDAFLDDPEPVLEESGLTREERELLLSGDTERIRAYIGENSLFTTGASTTSQFPSFVHIQFNFQFKSTGQLEKPKTDEDG
jgi:hypothetical protein